MAMDALRAAEDPIPDPTGISLYVSMSMAWRRSRVRWRMWACLRKSSFSPFMVFHGDLRTATVILRSTARVIAGFPYTTECSPRITNFPGAEAVCHSDFIRPDRTFWSLRKSHRSGCDR